MKERNGLIQEQLQEFSGEEVKDDFHKLMRDFLGSEDFKTLRNSFLELEKVYQDEVSNLRLKGGELHTRATLVSFLQSYQKEERIISEMQDSSKKLKRNFRVLLVGILKTKPKGKLRNFGRWLVRAILLLLVVASLNFTLKFNVPYANWRLGAKVQSYFETNRRAAREEIERIVIVGHRGSRYHGNENTMSSIRRGIARGAQIIEIDLQATNDGHLVLFHNLTVDETTNGRGTLSEMSLEQIRQLRLSNGERIPSLQEVLGQFRGTRFIFDIKQSGISQMVLEAVNRNNLQNRVIIFGDHEIIGEYKDLGLRTGLTFFFKDAGNLARFFTDYTSVINITQGYGCHYLVIPTSFVRRGLIEEAEETGMEVWAYGQDDELDMEDKINHGVSGLIVDDPAMAHSTIERMLH